MSDRILLSVIIPTYNPGDEVLDAISTLNHDSEKDIEILIVDDGSDEWAIQILTKLEFKIKCTIIFNKHTGNWINSVNQGIKECNGLYISILHQDDLWDLSKKRLIIRYIKDYPEVDFFFHESFFLKSNGVPIGIWKFPTLFEGNLDSVQFIKSMLIQNNIAVSSVVFKKCKAIEVGLMNPNFWYLGDWDFWIRLGLCSTVFFIKKPLSSFRIHKNSQTVIRSKQISQLNSQYQEFLNSFFITNDRIFGHLKGSAFFSAHINLMLFSFFNLQILGGFRFLFAALLTDKVNPAYFVRCSRLFSRLAPRVVEFTRFFN